MFCRMSYKKLQVKTNRKKNNDDDDDVVNNPVFIKMRERASK